MLAIRSTPESDRLLEGKNGLAFRRGADMGFQGLPVDDVNGAVEQAGDGPLQAHIVVDRQRRFGINVDQDVGIAVGAIVAARSRTEQGGTSSPRAPARRARFGEAGRGFPAGSSRCSYHRSPSVSTGKLGLNSAPASRPTAHGSGPMRVATPSSQRTSTAYSLPVSRRTCHRNPSLNWTLIPNHSIGFHCLFTRAPSPA